MGLSVAIVARPRRGSGVIEKGAVIVNECDRLFDAVPRLKDYFYLVERRGWFGMNKERSADVKLVDDLTTMEETRRKFPRAIVLEFANGDFVDTDKFRPLGIPKTYTGIQIAAWQRFKRHDLFVEAAALLPDRKFLKFGHFWLGPGHWGWLTSSLRRRRIIRKARRLKSSIDFPFSDAKDIRGLLWNAEEVNRLMNAAKMGILTSEHEGLNRFKMECLSADIPMLVPEDAGSATTRHINEKTGVLFEPTPEKLAQAIRYVEHHLTDFSPRAYVVEYTGMHRALPALKRALQSLARRDGFARNYEEVYWDGRNESLVWGKERSIAEVERAMQEVI